MWRQVHTVRCEADVDFAWRYWTTVDNWTVDPAIERVVVEPAFAEGAHGRTITRDGSETQWTITAVAALTPGHAAHIQIPAPGATLHLHWRFQPAEPHGTALTQEMFLSGERAAEYEHQASTVLGHNVLDGMRQLAASIDAAYQATGAARSPGRR